MLDHPLECLPLLWSQARRFDREVDLADPVRIVGPGVATSGDRVRSPRPVGPFDSRVGSGVTQVLAAYDEAEDNRGRRINSRAAREPTRLRILRPSWSSSNSNSQVRRVGRLRGAEVLLVRWTSNFQCEPSSFWSWQLSWPVERTRRALRTVEALRPALTEFATAEGCEVDSGELVYAS